MQYLVISKYSIMTDLGCSQYTCIECGATSPQLFKELRPGIIQISQCSHCSSAVDKYIEYDAVIILLDALLHKPQAYRHLLFNSSFNSPWKLLVILLLCDAYIKWDHLQPVDVATPQHHEILDVALEWHFYRAFGLAALEWLLFTVCVVGLLSLRSAAGPVASASSPVRWSALVRGLVLSSCGKLLAIPAVIWAQTHSPLYLLLTKVLIFTSTVTALRVLSSLGRPGAASVLAGALLLQHSLVSIWDH